MSVSPIISVYEQNRLYEQQKAPHDKAQSSGFILVLFGAMAFLFGQLGTTRRETAKANIAFYTGKAAYEKATYEIDGRVIETTVGEKIQQEQKIMAGNSLQFINGCNAALPILSGAGLGIILMGAILKIHLKKQFRKSQKRAAHGDLKCGL